MKTLQKKFTKFRTRVYSRHPTHSVLREELALLPFRSVVRLGSTTPCMDDVTHGGKRIECNTIQGVKNSSNKLLMKKCFENAHIQHADWFLLENGHFIQISAALNENQAIVPRAELPFPLVMKHIYGSRGTGNSLITSLEALEQALVGKTMSNYIFEKFYSYTREYRLHVSADGCFYTCRKMLKQGTPEGKKWQRHDENCVWVIEENPNFDKPINWENIVNDCKKALVTLNLDVAAFDVKVQSAKNEEGTKRKDPKYIILESNSAPSFGQFTAENYLIEIPKILKRKYEALFKL
jgi:hypothetical protein